MLFRPVYVPLRGEHAHRVVARTARNNMQRGPPCEEPVLFTLIRQL
jgi:hypothetical protein